MIVRPRPQLRELFLIWKGSIVPLILPQLVFVTLIATAVTALALFLGPRFPDFSATPFTFLGLSLSLFLGFRNNACYDRWWEGRKLYGGLLIEARSLGRESCLLADQPAARDRLLRLATAFVHGLTAHLRGRPMDLALRPWLEEGETQAVLAARNPPDRLLGLMNDILMDALRGQHLDSVTYRSLADHLQRLTAIQGSCERILGTALPFAYTLLLHRTAHLFCLLLPFVVVHSLGIATPLLTALVAYTYFGLDALGDQLEEPFGTAQNDLPLDAITRRIEIDLGEYRGLDSLPPPLQAQDYVLL